MDYNDNDMEVRSSELCSTVLAARCRGALILIMILYNDSDIIIHRAGHHALKTGE